MQVFDFYENKTLTVQVPKRSNCICQNSNLNIDDISDLNIALDASCETSNWIDVREADELGKGNLDSVLNWPLSRIRKGQLPMQLTDQRVITVCKSGARAKVAAEILKINGFVNVKYASERIYGTKNR